VPLERMPGAFTTKADANGRRAARDALMHTITYKHMADVE
jgi:hypothetical protein